MERSTRLSLFLSFSRLLIEDVQVLFRRSRPVLLDDSDLSASSDSPVTLRDGVRLGLTISVLRLISYFPDPLSRCRDRHSFGSG